MKATKVGNKYQITYRCPNYEKIINERFDTLEEANLRIAQVELEKKRGTLLPPAELIDSDHLDMLRQTMTVNRLLDEYVNMYGVKHWSEGTLSCNLHRIDDYIRPYIGELLIKNLTTHRLEQFYDQLRTTPAVRMAGHKETGTISPSVIEKIHAILRSALNQAIRWDYLRGANPALAVELPVYKKTKREVLSDEEARRALDVCDDPTLKLCLYLALGCSMRIGEILGLTWDCVHIEEDLINSDNAWLDVNKELHRCNTKNLEMLRKQGRDEVIFSFPAIKKNHCSTTLVLKTPKTDSSVRQIYLPRTIADVLAKHKSEQNAAKADLADEYQDYNLVVAQENGRPFEVRQIDRKFKALTAANNLPEIVFHSLRHSSTSIKLKISGGDIKSVQGDTGHAVSDMVTDVYSHIFDNNRKHLAKQVEEQFFAPLESKKAAALPDPTNPQAQVAQLLGERPELANAILQMAQLFGANEKGNLA